MKLLNSNPERNWYLIEEWTTKAGLRAKILQCVWSDKVKEVHREIADEFEKKYPEYKDMPYRHGIHDHYTGYVEIPEGTSRKFYDAPDIEVHGGITFEGKMDGQIPDETGMWTGFDLAHLGDERIAEPLAYARKECESLADQIIALKDEAVG